MNIRQSPSCFLCLCIIFSLLSACAGAGQNYTVDDSPDSFQDAVDSGTSQDVLEKASEGNPGESSVPESVVNSDSGIYNNSFISDDGTVNITLSLEKSLLDFSKIPVYTFDVEPYYFTGDDARSIAQTLFPGSVFYNYKSSMGRKYESALLSGDVSGFTLCDFEFRDVSYYYSNFAPGADPGQDIFAIAAYNGIAYNFNASIRNADDYRLSMISTYCGRNVWPEYAGTTIPAQDNIISVSRTAQDLIDRLGFGTWTLTSASPFSFSSDDGEKYVIEFYASPVYYDVSVPFRVRQTVIKDMPADADDYYYESIKLVYGIDGTLLSFEFLSPVQIVEGSAYYEQELTYENTVRILSAGLEQSTSADYQADDDSAYTSNVINVYITDCSLCYVRTRSTEDPHYYTYIPCIAVYGRIGADSADTSVSVDDNLLLTISIPTSSVINHQ